MPDRHDDDYDPPSWLVSAAKTAGMNEIRVRWKLRGWHRKYVALRRDFAPASRRFEHQICGECGAVQDSDAKVCSSCGAKLSSSAARFLKSLGFSIPSAWSVSSLLGFAMVLIYVRMVLANPGDGLWGWKPGVLEAYGGLWPPALRLGQWWRLATACFLHIGVLHLGFNLFALVQIGPNVEEIFGRARMVFLFMVTGVVAFAASALFMPGVPTAGASGPLMGLIGVAAGWGQRVGTTLGKDVRNQMLMWLVYTSIFGIALNANHVAHGGGFLCGAVLGYAFDPNRLAHTKGSTGSAALGVVGGLAAAATVFLALVPPASSRDLGRQLAGRQEEEWIAMAQHDEAERQELVVLVAACDLLRAGKEPEARAKLDELPPRAGAREGRDLRMGCSVVEAMRTQCAEFDARGLEGIYGEQLPPDDETREMLGRQWRESCAVLTPRR